MSNILVVGEFRNSRTGEICTVIKLMPTDFRPGSECYVTQDAEFLEQDPIDPNRFRTADGDTLVVA